MQKFLYELTAILLISFFITLSNAFAKDNSTLKAFNSKTGFYYTVQKGDTLWDLSQKFYNSEWDWPGLWELNDEIKNPHLIYPGERLRVFFKGELSLENRPVVEPVKTQEQVIDDKTGKIEEVAAPEPAINLTFLYPLINRVGFIKKNAVKPLGKILRSEDKDNDLISENDIIYVKASKADSLTPGKQYQIYKTTKIWRKGIRHSIKGIIQIKEAKKDYFTAVVTEAYIDINPDDTIMEFTPRDKEFIVKNNNEKINASIICNDADDAIFGSDDIVYMDIGETDNIETGQIYTVYKNLKKKEVSFDPVDTGRMIVLHTEDISSTVLIFTAKEEMHPEDPVH